MIEAAEEVRVAEELAWQLYEWWNEAAATVLLETRTPTVHVVSLLANKGANLEARRFEIYALMCLIVDTFAKQCSVFF